MTIRDLLEALSNLPMAERGKEVLIDTGEDHYYDFTVNSVLDNSETVGYILTRAVHYDGDKQLKLPFGEENE